MTGWLVEHEHLVTMVMLAVGCFILGMGTTALRLDNFRRRLTVWEQELVHADQMLEYRQAGRLLPDDDGAPPAVKPEPAAEEMFRVNARASGVAAVAVAKPEQPPDTAALDEHTQPMPAGSNLPARDTGVLELGFLNPSEDGPVEAVPDEPPGPTSWADAEPATPGPGWLQLWAFYAYHRVRLATVRQVRAVRWLTAGWWWQLRAWPPLLQAHRRLQPAPPPEPLRAEGPVSHRMRRGLKPLQALLLDIAERDRRALPLDEWVANPSPTVVAQVLPKRVPAAALDEAEQEAAYRRSLAEVDRQLELVGAGHGSR